MRSVPVEFSLNGADFSSIHGHLLDCSRDFVPTLDSYVDIPSYSRKIENLAETFEAWECGRLVALVALYLNDFQNRVAFVTNVSVCREFRRSGLALSLLLWAIEISAESGFHRVELEVSRECSRAIGLYSRLGFLSASQDGKWIHMGKTLQR